MTDTPQGQKTETGATQVPGQTRGEERITRQPTPFSPLDETPPPPEPSAWTGYITFAATLMLLVGGFQAIMGITALFEDNYFVVGTSGLVVSANWTAWGWTHIAIGAIAIAAGAGLFTGQMWARVLGVAVAMISAIVQMAFIPAFPLWSVTVIAIDVFAIYAITAHGREMRS